MLRRTLVIWLVFLGLPLSSFADASESTNPWIFTPFGGQMTSNVWEEALNPTQTEFIDSYLVGLAVGKDFARKEKWDFGWEGQVVAHFGEQDHFEFNVPVYARYYLPESWRILKSLTFGLGLSYATEVPPVEIAIDGESSQLLVYWMGELEFHLPSDDLTLVFRLHHRSNAFGLIPEDGGSNAFVLGLRWRM